MIKAMPEDDGQNISHREEERFVSPLRPFHEASPAKTAGRALLPPPARGSPSLPAATHFKFMDLMKKFDKTFAATPGADKRYGKSTPDRTIEDVKVRRQDRASRVLGRGFEGTQ